MPIILEYSGTRRTLQMPAISSRCSDLLNDADLLRWPLVERIRWANEAMGAIMMRRPAAFAVREVMVLREGSYQAIPLNGSQFIDLVRNIGSDGVTPGRAIRRSDRQQLDDADPDWHTGAQKAQVRQYLFDDRVPTVFYVYPPVISGTKVEVLHAALPDLVLEDNADGEFAIGLEYLEAVVNYVCYRARSKDAEDGQSGDAVAFYGAFEASLGAKNESSNAASPNQPANSV